MKLVFIYGRPAVGKLTVARALAAQTGGRLFHNHLAVNLALSMYDFGTPEFIAYRELLWNDAFRRAREGRIPLLIFTFNPENTVSQRFVDGLLSDYAAEESEVIPVELVASEATIEARLGSESRRRDGKALDVAMYRELRARGSFETPAMPSPKLRLDTEKLSSAEAAAKISALIY
jgi:hypothetical protein